MALNVNIIGMDSEGNLRALKVNSEGNLDFGQLETEIQAVKDNQGRLYGKYGETWIPVKVDSEGRPILASDVTVNAQGLVVDLGQIKQGPAGTQPWPVQLSGTVVEVATIVDAVALTGVQSQYYYIPESFQRYPDLDFEITNTLDQDVHIVVITGTGSGSAASVMLEDGTIATYGTIDNGVTHLVPSGVKRIMLSEIPAKKRNTDLKTLTQRPWNSLASRQRLMVRAFTAPTSGALTIRVVGRIR